jgi:hypothetical protein
MSAEDGMFDLRESDYLVWVCKECGSVVNDLVLHEKWHKKLKDESN